MLRERDLPANLNEVVGAAREMWIESAKKEFEKDGDYGSCILGDGICIDVIPKGKRKPVQKMLISAREVAQCQGSIHYERGQSAVVEYLKSQGIDAYYESGWMD